MISRRYILRKDEIIWEEESKNQESKFWLKEDELSYDPNKTKDWSRPIYKRQEGSKEWKLMKEIRRMKVSDKNKKKD